MTSVIASAPSKQRFVRHEEKLKTMLSHPLIVGASVSADYYTKSPAKRLALRYTTLDQISILARNGTPGKLTIVGITPELLHDRSIVIGLDMFFWDATQVDAVPSLAAIEKLVALTQTAKIPLVLGNVPSLMPALQPRRAMINAKIASVCQPENGCYMLDLDSIFHKTMHAGGVIFRGKHYGLQDLLPDGLHIADVAAEYLADSLEQLLDR
jgi:hypothetical protein